MTSTSAQLYAALRARDSRFDGIFFVGVKTTGIYCRPICRARTPLFRNVEFFASAALAEANAYRACFLCRPEVAPQKAAHHAALRRLLEAPLSTVSVSALAEEMGCTTRHYRRLIEQACGASPVQVLQSRRLALAKALLHDSSLPMLEVAEAAGFKSLTQFNRSFAQRFSLSPTKARAQLRQKAKFPITTETLELRLDYRIPFDFASTLQFLHARTLPGVEQVADGSYSRLWPHGDKVGVLKVEDEPEHGRLKVHVSRELVPCIDHVLLATRRVFDLDAEPAVIAERLHLVPALGSERNPGLRIPGAFVAFECAMRAVLGQQVSVKGATTLAARLCERFSVPLPASAARTESLFCLAPTAHAIATADIDALRAIGLPRQRAETLRDVAACFSAWPDGDVGFDALLKQLAKIKGIGPWTLDYLSLRLRVDPDAFPSGDLVVRQALAGNRQSPLKPNEAEQRVEACWPFRAYAAVHLWRNFHAATR